MRCRWGSIGETYDKCFFECRAGRYPLPATIPLGIVAFLLLALSCFPSPNPLFAQSQAAGQTPTSQAATPAQAQSTPASQQPGTTTSQPQGSDEKDVAELTTHQESDTTFKVNVNLVVVRCVVRDNQGDLSAQNGAVEIP